MIGSGLKKWLTTALKLLILVLIVWWIHRAIYEAWQQLEQHRWQLQPAWLLVSATLYLLGLLPAGLYWHRLLRVLGQEPGLAETLRAYFVGHLGKYVPGKAMVVILRTGLIRGCRVDTAVAAASVFFETLTMMAVGAFLAAVVLAIQFHGEHLLFAAAIAMMLVAGLPTLPPLFLRLVRLVGVGRFSPRSTERLARLGYGTFALGWAAMFVSWVLLGASLWAALRAMGIDEPSPLLEMPRYTASVALATVAGFASFIPGGAVVREAVLAQLMEPYFGAFATLESAPATALLSAVLLRLVWLVTEVVVSGILYLGRKTPDRARSP